MAEIKVEKKSRLTLYIVIALVAGIILGFILNKSYIHNENQSIQTADVKIESLKKDLLHATDSNAHETLSAEKNLVSQQRSEALAARDKKMEPFSLLADVFLRLIKMIVAPLVLCTL